MLPPSGIACMAGEAVGAGVSTGFGATTFGVGLGTIGTGFAAKTGAATGAGVCSAAGVGACSTAGAPEAIPAA